VRGIGRLDSFEGVSGWLEVMRAGVSSGGSIAELRTLVEATDMHEESAECGEEAYVSRWGSIS
jgi:hypothetical protein